MTDDLTPLERDIEQNREDEIALTDTGNGRIFVQLYGQQVRYATDTERWYLWSKNGWQLDTGNALGAFALTQGVIRARRDEEMRTTRDDPAITNRNLREITRLESVGRRRAMLDTAAADPALHVEEDWFDATRDFIATGDRMLVNLTTGEVRPARPDDMFARRTTVPYDLTAHSPLMNEFFETFLPSVEDQRFVFAVLGQCLRGGNPRRMFPIIWGDTTSGKSQLMTGVHNVLGEFSTAVGSSIFRGNLDDKPRPDLVKAMFSRLAWASEASKAWALHADQIKRLTGGEPLPYRNLFKGLVGREPRFTPLLVTNTMPRITGADGPTKRRIFVIHFDKTLTKEQERPEKRAAFLNDETCRRHLLRLIIDGARDDIIDRMPERYALATMETRGGIDHTDEFLAWMREEGYLAEIPLDAPILECVRLRDLYSAYRFWVQYMTDKSDKLDTLGRNSFNTAIRDKQWESRESGGARWLGRRLITENIPIDVRVRMQLG